MKTATVSTSARVLAALNGAYQGVVGVLSLASPTTAGAIYDLSNISPTSAALTRILGATMIGNALLLLMFARAPRKNTSLPWLLLAASVAGVVANVVACATGELRWAQLAGSTAFQGALAISLGLYVARVR